MPRDRAARVDVAVAGGGRCRGDAERHDVARARALGGRDAGSHEGVHVADEVVGRHHQGDGAGPAALGQAGRDRHGRGGVAAHRLQRDLGLDADGGELLGHDEAHVVAGDDQRLEEGGWPKRLAVTWKLDRSSSSGMNCFGMLSRDAGHSRVPEPPHMMTGRIFSAPKCGSGRDDSNWLFMGGSESAFLIDTTARGQSGRQITPIDRSTHVGAPSVDHMRSAGAREGVSPDDRCQRARDTTSLGLRPS